MLKSDGFEESTFCLPERFLLILSQEEQSTFLHQACKRLGWSSRAALGKNDRKKDWGTGNFLPLTKGQGNLVQLLCVLATAWCRWRPWPARGTLAQRRRFRTWVSWTPWSSEIKLKSPKRSHNHSFSWASHVERHLIVAFNKIKSRENKFTLQLKNSTNVNCKLHMNQW